MILFLIQGKCFEWVNLRGTLYMYIYEHVSTHTYTVKYTLYIKRVHAGCYHDNIIDTRARLTVIVACTMQRVLHVVTHINATYLRWHACVSDIIIANYIRHLLVLLLHAYIVFTDVFCYFHSRHRRHYTVVSNASLRRYTLRDSLVCIHVIQLPRIFNIFVRRFNCNINKYYNR